MEYLSPVLPSSPDSGDRGHGRKMHVACHRFEYTCGIVATAFDAWVDVGAIARRNPSGSSKSDGNFYKTDHWQICRVVANDSSANDVHLEKCDSTKGVLIRAKIKPAIFAWRSEWGTGCFSSIVMTTKENLRKVRFGKVPTCDCPSPTTETYAIATRHEQISLAQSFYGV